MRAALEKWWREEDGDESGSESVASSVISRGSGVVAGGRGRGGRSSGEAGTRGVRSCFDGRGGGRGGGRSGGRGGVVLSAKPRFAAGVAEAKGGDDPCPREDAPSVIGADPWRAPAGSPCVRTVRSSMPPALSWAR